jgi:hypothetical protein
LQGLGGELEIGRLNAFISIRSKWQCEVGGTDPSVLGSCMKCWVAKLEVVVASKREVGPGRSLSYSNRAKSWGCKAPTTTPTVFNNISHEEERS